MISIYAAFLLLFFYGLCQYLIARWGESHSPLADKVKRSATTYSFSLAVYCTSWTYYGNIGQASEHGIHYVSLYLGSTLVFILMTPLLKQMVRIKNVYHSTSIADFISTRYNNSQLLAAVITILCLIGITPYISIQLKSVITTFELLVNSAEHQQNFFISQLDFIVVFLMAVFTILFGLRRLDPTERHSGMMVAIAAESIFKLIAFLAAGIFICFVVFDGFADIVSTVSANTTVNKRLEIFSQPPVLSAWFASMLMGAIGVLALPRQFHVGVVECADENMLNRARWLFPLYLLIINLLVFPIAMAGLLVLPNESRVDLMLLNIPIIHQQTGIAIMVFLGGFAAATGMIMISAMTLSTMATNHLIVPMIENTPRWQFLRRYLLPTRWAVVTVILLLSLFYYRVIGDSALLVNIGSISFVAVAQLVPALIGGLMWKRGNVYGAIAGVLGGTAIWFFTSLLPSVIRSGWLHTDLLTEGLFGFSWLRPEQLFGMQISSTTAHSLAWSLSINLYLYILISAWVKITDKEQLEHTKKFMDIGLAKKKFVLSNKNLMANIALIEKKTILKLLFGRYLSDHMAHEKLVICCQRSEIGDHEFINVIQLVQLKSQATSMLAGIIGMAASYKAVKLAQLFNESEQQLLTAYYSDLLAKSELSPEKLLEKVDYYQEKQELLENHSQLQEQAIHQLKMEKEQTLQAKADLKILNEQLEQRVNDRTKELSNANHDLTFAMDELKSTQNKLVEAEKMASLGALVAGVAHEINTPVGVVLTAISSLEKECNWFNKLYREQNITIHDMEKFLQNLSEVTELSMKNIRRATQLIESFKQVAVDQTSERSRIFNVYDYLQDILLSLAPQLKKSKHHLEIVCDKALTIDSYPGALSQIISNFIINSLLHAFEPEQAGNIHISISLLDNILQLEYRDDGKGLSAEGIENIFEPFYTTRRGSGGTGLGAHIIYNIVTQLLQGEISLNTHLKKGLGFRLKFPVNNRQKNIQKLTAIYLSSVPVNATVRVRSILTAIHGLSFRNNLFLLVIEHLLSLQNKQGVNYSPHGLAGPEALSRVTFAFFARKRSASSKLNTAGALGF